MARSGVFVRFVLTLILAAATASTIPALAQQAPAPATASPGRSGGEGGGFGKDVTLEPATKEKPYLRTIVGQPSGPPQGDDPQSKCLRMAWSDATDIPGAPTSIVEVSAKVASDGKTMVCQLDGYVNPQVGFRLLMPLNNWNGKYMQNGCGGACGGPIYIVCEVQVLRGYACLAADLGHRGTTYDSVWAIEDPMAQIDSQWRATHVAALAGKELTKRYYGQAPRYSYFQGASTGGRQGNIIVQRFPDDFDGVVAGEGGPNRNDGSRPGLQGVTGGRALSDASGKPMITANELRMIHSRVMAQCDDADGLKDGIITDPRACGFKPASLLCTGAKTPACLSDAQVAALEHVYNGGRGPQFGSEIGWIGAYVAEDGTSGRYARARPAVAPQSTFVGGFGPPNPDLTAFKARGGKFILYQGWADEVVDPIGPTQFYEKVEKLFGRQDTQSFFRLFMVPGQSHIPGGVGAESIDYIGALENWVEKGQAPDVLVGHKLKWITQMMGPQYLEKDLQPSNYLYSRPVYPYPLQAHYRGGDPDSAKSFAPWNPATRKFVR